MMNLDNINPDNENIQNYDAAKRHYIEIKRLADRFKLESIDALRFGSDKVITWYSPDGYEDASDLDILEDNNINLL